MQIKRTGVRKGGPTLCGAYLVLAGMAATNCKDEALLLGEGLGKGEGGI